MFGHIKSLPVDIVKIDGTLVNCFVDQAVSLATIRAINDIGVDYVQGDLLGEPRPLPSIH